MFVSRYLFHLFGPVYVCSYGLTIVLGILFFIWLVNRDFSRKSLILSGQIYDLFALGICGGIIGGRLLYLIMNMADHESSLNVFYYSFAIWDGGFSVLGSILCIFIVLFLYARIYHIDVLRLADLMSLYAPVLQGIGRIGCLFAGCCYGIETNSWWGIVYSSESFVCAPTGVNLHPTQLYSAFFLGMLYIIMKYVLRPRCFIPGQITAWYFFLVSAERFIVDFWRGDREYMIGIPGGELFSVHQYIALACAIGAIIALAILKSCTNLPQPLRFRTNL